MKINKGKQFAQIIERKETPDAIKNMLLHLFTDAQNRAQTGDHPKMLEAGFNYMLKDGVGGTNSELESLKRAIEIELGERPLKVESEYKKFLAIAKSWEPLYYIHPLLLGARIQIAVDDESTSDGLIDVLERQVNRLAEWAGMSWTAIETIEQYFPLIVKELIRKNGAKKTANELLFFDYLLEGQNGYTWRQHEERQLKTLYHHDFWMKAANVIQSNKNPVRASQVFSIFIQMYPDIFDEVMIEKVSNLTGVKPFEKQSDVNLSESESPTEENPLNLSEVPAPKEGESLSIGDCYEILLSCRHLPEKVRAAITAEIADEEPLDLSEVKAPKDGECIDLAKSLSEVLRHPQCPDKLHEVISDQIGTLEQPNEYFTSPEYLARVLCANDEVSE